MNATIPVGRHLLFPVVGWLLIGVVVACGGPTGEAEPTGAPAPQSTQPASSPAATAQPGGATPAAVPDALWKKVREDGTVMVIVTLNVPYQPESQLGSQREIDAQRAAIAAAQDDLVASLTEGHVEVNTRMTLFPQIALTVDEPALRQLAASPLVAAIEENALSAPTSATPLSEGGRL